MTMGVGAGGCLLTVCAVCDATRGTGVIGTMVSASASAAPITSSLRCESLRQFGVQVHGEHDGSRGERQPKNPITRNIEI
jgi:hypothetical protein